MAEERTQCRLAAIPAGDVFGYTRLVEHAVRNLAPRS